MEIIRSQPLNVFGRHQVQTLPMKILAYLFIGSGILISVWMFRALKVKKLSTPMLNFVSKPGYGWSLDLTQKGSSVSTNKTGKEAGTNQNSIEC